MSRKYNRKPPVKTGDRFSRLVVVGKSGSGGELQWNCLCDCGALKTILDRSLKNGHTRSCGCLFLEESAKKGRAKRTHGHSPKVNGKQQLTPEYRAWRSMRRRCYKPNVRGYKYYGAKGITVCERWLESFENFYADMGDRPSARHSIERRNSKGNYEPSNCKWATRTEQNRNKSNNLYVTIEGKTRCIGEWASLTGIRAATLQQRFHANWPAHQMLIKPQLGRRINAVR